MKKKIGITFGGIIILLAFIIKTDDLYLTDLVKTISKTHRIKADITDYKFFNNIDVPKSENPQPWPIHKSFNNIQPTEKLKSINEELGTVAFLIIKNDSIWYEKYNDDYGPKSYSNSFSMAKSIISAVMGRAINEGYFSGLDDKVGNYISEYKKGLASNLTIGDLSSMSSGMLWDESYSDIFGVTARSYVSSELNTLIKSRPIIESPGKEFKYLSGNTQLLAMTIEKATNREISDLVYHWFWNPMGAENNALWQIDSKKNNTTKAYCCFNSNARDFARFGKLYKDSGNWKGHKILDSSFVTQSIKPRFSKSPEYGYGFWLGEFNNNSFFAMRGILGQYVIVFPEKNIILVRLGKKNLEKFNNRPKDFDIYIEEAFKMLDLT
jgi:CubicO group peptidase (beta-lactamase class C family)